MKRMGRFIWGGCIGLLATGASQACPVCILADPKTAGTYLSTTLFMSVLPLAMLGGLIYWLKRQYSPRPIAPVSHRVEARAATELIAHHQV